VAPVFSEDGTVTYYVPAGRWTHLISGLVVEGSGWRTESHPYSSLPLLVRPNSVIPVGSSDARADYDFPEGVTLRAYQIEDGALVNVAIPTQDGRPGSTFTLKRTGDEIAVSPGPTVSDWRLLLVGEVCKSATNGTLDAVAEGCVVVPNSRDAAVTVILAKSATGAAS